MVKGMEASLNDIDKNIKSLEFEIKMISWLKRDPFNDKLKKVRLNYNECRAVYFQMEDDLQKKVLGVTSMGSEPNEKGKKPDDKKRLVEGIT
mmetsp:Transcript_23758/g.23446  ORF Transcript_23758/g.23446 Transcript_23758/m.23446 type:complete len:92 (-) Transcript_23758:128-403(-)